MKDSIVKIIIVSLLVGLNGCIKTSSTINPIACNVSLSSAAGGGRIEVNRFDPKPRTVSSGRFQIIWHLPSSSPSIDLVVGYGHELAPLTKLHGGGHARFVIPNGAKADKYSAELDVQGVGKWVFPNAEFNFGSDEGDLLFGNNTERGKAIIDAIDNKNKFKLTIFNDSEAFAASTFDPSETNERDFVYNRAKELVETSDPKYCHTF